MSTNGKEFLITGLGIVTPIGTGKEQFTAALKEGRSHFSVTEWEQEDQVFRFPLGKADEFSLPSLVSTLTLDAELVTAARRLRNLSQSSAFGVYSALEAWADAGINAGNTDLSRVAIVVGGSNTQQASLVAAQEKYRGRLQFINPNYGLNFFDTDLAGALSELLGITGEAHSVGAASASGNAALIQAHRLIGTGAYDLVLAVAPLMDLSIYEYQAFTMLGAMARVEDEYPPSGLCRPFDAAHKGFVYGQCAGCVVLESAEHAAARGQQPYASLAGYGVSMDANRNPNPSAEGERRAMMKAMEFAGIQPGQVDYVNTHGTASVIGDQAEVEALLIAGLEGVKANSTKSLTGHGLTAAGMVECIATLIQMKEGFLHPGKNLSDPITDRIDWIREEAVFTQLNYALSNSFGFGGINTSIILKNYQHEKKI